MEKALKREKLDKIVLFHSKYHFSRTSLLKNLIKQDLLNNVFSQANAKSVRVLLISFQKYFIQHFVPFLDNQPIYELFDRFQTFRMKL